MAVAGSVWRVTIGRDPIVEVQQFASMLIPAILDEGGNTIGNIVNFPMEIDRIWCKCLHIGFLKRPEAYRYIRRYGVRKVLQVSNSKVRDGL